MAVPFLAGPKRITSFGILVALKSQTLKKCASWSLILILSPGDASFLLLIFSWLLSPGSWLCPLSSYSSIWVLIGLLWGSSWFLFCIHLNLLFEFCLPWIPCRVLFWIRNPDSSCQPQDVQGIRRKTARDVHTSGPWPRLCHLAWVSLYVSEDGTSDFSRTLFIMDPRTYATESSFQVKSFRALYRSYTKELTLPGHYQHS